MSEQQASESGRPPWISQDRWNTLVLREAIFDAQTKGMSDEEVEKYVREKFGRASGGAAEGAHG